jgi:uncharacterized protein YdeI (YjbR/CyaY-like superfamily)
MNSADPLAFPTRAAFRTWLKQHHRTATELLVLIFRTHASDRGLTYADALDEALCFGWIDGVRRSVDGESFSIRFSPRKSRSIWSRVNVTHVERLIREGRMTKAGLEAYTARSPHRTGIYSFEQRPVTLAPAYVRQFRANAAAWKYFQARPPWYRRTSSFWIMSAKREETRLRRLGSLIDCSARQQSIHLLTRPTKGLT